MIYNTRKNIIPPREIVEDEVVVKAIREISSNEKNLDQQQLYVLYYWKNLCKMLLAVGLEFKVKSLKDGFLALCVHCPDDVLAVEYYKFR